MIVLLRLCQHRSSGQHRRSSSQHRRLGQPGRGPPCSFCLVALCVRYRARGRRCNDFVLHCDQRGDHRPASCLVSSIMSALAAVVESHRQTIAAALTLIPCARRHLCAVFVVAGRDFEQVTVDVCWQGTYLSNVTARQRSLDKWRDK